MANTGAKATRVAVFCSANDVPEFNLAAERFAQGLAQRRWELVYGGAQAGLMGRFANAMLKAGGVVRGAITAELAREREMAHPGLAELAVVPDLLERKRWMMDRADAFVIFPGGLGTLDEAIEAITWRGLGYHSKPIVFVNLGGFWQHQIKVFEEMAASGMVRAGGLEAYRLCDSVEETWKVLDVSIGRATVRN